MAIITNFLRAFIQELKSITMENALLRYRLGQSTAYTWTNLLLVCSMLLVGGGSLVRLLDLAQAWRMAIKIPAEGRAEVRRSLWIDWPFKPGAEDGFDSYSQGGMAELGFLAQFAGTAGILICMAGAVLFARRFRRNWARPDSEEMRILPLTPRQMLLALYDWPVFKASVCFFIAFALQCLPGRILFDPKERFDVAWSFNPEWAALAIYFAAWSVLFSIHRTCQVLRYDWTVFFMGRLFWVWLVLGTIGFLFIWETVGARPPLSSAIMLFTMACMALISGFLAFTADKCLVRLIAHAEAGRQVD